MKVINGIIIDGKLYRAVANGKLCSECCLVSDHEKCNEIKPCSVFGNGYIFLEEGKVSQILTCDKEYAELYVAHKGDILKFPEEIETSERDYYEGDFEFKSGCGFIRYRIDARCFNILYDYRGKIYGKTIKLSIDVEDFSEDMYNRMTKDIVGEDLVLLLEHKEMYCIYGQNVPSEVWMERKDGRLTLFVEVMVKTYMPYLKSGKVEAIEDVRNIKYR